MGVRLFTTERIFDETRAHLWFANRVIETHGATSPYIISAATGEPPYRKGNQFLEGFLRWQAAGNPAEWSGYMLQALGHDEPGPDQIRERLSKLGVEVVSLEAWPGYIAEDDAQLQHITAEIVGHSEERLERDVGEALDFEVDFHKKAEPEAEVFMIVKKERAGDYNLLSELDQESPAWFISQTSMLNLIEPGNQVTWQPEAFLRFTSTLAPSTDRDSADRAFEILLLAFGQAGVSVLGDKTIELASIGMIDQAVLKIDELTELYERVLSKKYAETPQSIFERIKPGRRPIAAIQLASEIAEAEAQDREIAEIRAREASARATRAEKELESLEGVKGKIVEKRRKQARRARQRKSRSKGGKKRKK